MIKNKIPVKKVGKLAKKLSGEKKKESSEKNYPQKEIDSRANFGCNLKSWVSSPEREISPTLVIS